MKHRPEIDQFAGKIIKIGTSMGIIVPAKNMEFSGLKEGDIMKMWYKRIQSKTDEE